MRIYWSNWHQDYIFENAFVDTLGYRHRLAIIYEEAGKQNEYWRLYDGNEDDLVYILEVK